MQNFKIQLIIVVLTFFVSCLIVGFGMHGVAWDFNQVFVQLLMILKTPFGQIFALWLLSSGTALAIFAIFEARVRHNYYLLWVLPIIIIFSIGVALPFYLYLRAPKRDQ